MADKKKIIDGCENWVKNHCGEDLVLEFSAIVELLEVLKEQNELIKAMKRDLDLVRSCKVCGNWTECTPDAPPESPEFKMWRDCGGPCKLNWKWRGI